MSIDKLYPRLGPNRLFPRRGLLISLLFYACSSTPGPGARFGSGGSREPPGRGIEALEREMFRRLNRDRSERGLPPLRYDAELASIGRAHSRDMRENHFFEHESPTTGSLDDRLNRAGYLFVAARENLAEGPDVQRAEDSLLKSPGHFANIVATDTTHVGIGIVRGGVEAPKNLTITQVFAKPGRVESLASAQQSLITRIQAERRKRGNAVTPRDPLLGELAEKHIEELDAETSPASLGEVGKRVSKAIANAKRSDLQSVVVGAQLIADSDLFEAPESLVARPKARFGLAVRKVSGPKGRPMLQVLIIAALATSLDTR